jgi:hypothetical protein
MWSDPSVSGSETVPGSSENSNKTHELYKMLGISSLDEQPLASQEGVRWS